MAKGLTGRGLGGHVILVKTGEDVASKIMSFSQNGRRAVCIMSANGLISKVTLSEAAESNRNVTYEGRFEILSLNGIYMPAENDSPGSITRGLNVILSGSGGQIISGGVRGVLTAATNVQVTVCSFVPSQEVPNSESQSDGSASPSNSNLSGTAGDHSSSSSGTDSGSWSGSDSGSLSGSDSPSSESVAVVANGNL